MAARKTAQTIASNLLELQSDIERFAGKVVNGAQEAMEALKTLQNIKGFSDLAEKQPAKFAPGSDDKVSDILDDLDVFFNDLQSEGKLLTVIAKKGLTLTSYQSGGMLSDMILENIAKRRRRKRGTASFGNFEKESRSPSGDH